MHCTFVPSSSSGCPDSRVVRAHVVARRGSMQQPSRCTVRNSLLTDQVGTHGTEEGVIGRSHTVTRRRTPSVYKSTRLSRAHVSMSTRPRQFFLCIVLFFSFAFWDLVYHQGTSRRRVRNFFRLLLLEGRKGSKASCVALRCVRVRG